MTEANLAEFMPEEITEQLGEAELPERTFIRRP